MERTGPPEGPHPDRAGDAESAWLPDSALLTALFAEAPVGLGCWDTDFRYRRVNEVLAAMNGRPVAEHLGRRLSEVLPELGPQLEAMFDELLATGQARHDVRISGQTPAAPGVVRDWLASYFPLWGETGAAVGVGAIVVETTGERQASARASRAERTAVAIDAELRAVYAALPIGVGFVSPDLRYERVNEALAQMNGVPVEEHLGRTMHEVLGEHGAEAERITREVIRRRTPTQLELAVRASASADQERFFEGTYFPVFGQDVAGERGEVLGVGAVVRDVTAHHVAERERERLLNDALTARAQAEAAQVRAEAARQETEAALAEAEAARQATEAALAQVEAQRRVADAARRRAAFLANVTRRMAASLDYEATLREVVASAVPYIADWGVVSLVEPNGRLRVFGFAHSDPAREALVSEFAAHYIPGPGSSVTAAIRTGRPVVVTDATPEQLAGIGSGVERAALALKLGVRHFASWPIPSPDGTVIGALSFVLGHSGRSFSDEDLQVGQTLATRAGLHLTNARLYTERSEIARTLQASLLSRRLPDVPGIELAAAFVAAGEENIVGGDFYDVFASGDGVWTAILGDVAGKGAAAAALTATARHTLRAAALVSADPGENVALLNRVLLADGGAFCTVVDAHLCPSPGRLAVRITHAGHPPALVRRADGAVEAVTAGRGPLLGVYSDARFSEAELALAAGDVLLLYTDGVTEARPSDVALGEHELMATLRDTQGQPAGDVAEAVKDRALKLQGGSPRDDIAILAIRVTSTTA